MNGYPYSYPSLPAPQKTENDDLRLALPLMVRTLQQILSVLQGQGASGVSNTKRGWSQSFNLATPPNNGKSPQPQGSMQATFEEAGEHTVQIDVIPPIDAATGELVPFNAQAIVTWTVQGNKVTRKVSVGQGVSLSGSAEGVNVVVSDITAPNGHVPFTTSHAYTVTVTISPGTRPMFDQPPVLNVWTSNQVIAGGGQTTVAVPQNSGIISLRTYFQGPGAMGGGAIIIQMGDGAAVYREYDSSMYKDFVPIPAGCTQVTFINNDANNAYNLSADWGIDG